MPYRFPIPANLSDDHDETPERIAAFLAARGITAQVRVHVPPPPTTLPPSRDGALQFFIPASEPPALIIEADADPTEAMAAYVDTPTPRELAFTLLRRIVRDIRNPSQFPRTATERLNDVERAIVALVAIERFE